MSRVRAATVGRIGISRELLSSVGRRHNIPNGYAESKEVAHGTTSRMSSFGRVRFADTSARVTRQLFMRSSAADARQIGLPICKEAGALSQAMGTAS